MKKIIKKLKEVEETQHFCDLCGNEFHWGLCGRNTNICYVCKKEICSDCAINDDYFAWADDRAVVCKYCNEITKPFKTRLDETEEEYNTKTKQIWKEFKEEAEKNFKKHQKVTKNDNILV